MISPVRWIPNTRWMREKNHPSTEQGKKQLQKLQRQKKHNDQCSYKRSIRDNETFCKLDIAK